MQNALRAASEEEDEVDEEPGGAGVGQGQAGKRETQGSLRQTPTTGAQHLRRGAYKVRGTGTLAERSKGGARGRGRSRRRTWQEGKNGWGQARKETRRAAYKTPLKTRAPNPNPQAPTTSAQHLRRGAYKVTGTGALAERSKGGARGRGRSRRRTWRGRGRAGTSRKKRDASQPQANPNNRRTTLKEGSLQS